MPLKFTELVDKNIKIGLWKIEESIPWFLAELNLSDTEKEVYDLFVNEQRKRQWLSYRRLCREIIPDIPVNIEYDKHGKPFIKDHPGFISVSHAGEYSVVILSDKQKVGIDIEKISPRIEKIASRFLGKEEESFIKSNESLKYLYIIWGAKEALYKLYGKRNLDFQKQIFISPFEIHERGTFRGRIKNGTLNLTSELHYRILGEYVLVYTANTHE